MAELGVNPTLRVTGEIRGGGRSEFVDKATGEVTERYRAVILTGGGFLQVTIPRPLWGSVEFADGDLVDWIVAFSTWSFNDKKGSTFILDSVVKP